MSKSEITKFAISSTISYGVSKFVRNTVAEHTEIEDDSLLLVVGAGVVGQLVSNATEKYVDASVDKIAQAWQNRKAAKTTEE